MAKRKKKKAFALPPEGMWISPDGGQYEITEHLLALKERPDIFGLQDNDVKRADIPKLRDLAVELIESGWTRFRYLDGVWAFEVDKFSRRALLVEDVLSKCGAYSAEEVTISQLNPHRDFSGTVEDVFERRIERFQANPGRNKWRLS